MERASAHVKYRGGVLAYKKTPSPVSNFFTGTKLDPKNSTEIPAQRKPTVKLTAMMMLKKKRKVQRDCAWNDAVKVFKQSKY